MDEKELVFTEYMGVLIGVIKLQEDGGDRDRDSLCGLVGYLVSQEHMMREPMITHTLSIAIKGDNISVVQNKRVKPDPVGELLAQCLIVKAWGSPVGRHNGVVEFSTFGEKDEEPEAS